MGIVYVLIDISDLALHQAVLVSIWQVQQREYVAYFFLLHPQFKSSFFSLCFKLKNELTRTYEIIPNIYILYESCKILSLFSVAGNAHVGKYLLGQAETLSSLSRSNVITLAGIYTTGNKIGPGGL